MLSSTDSLTYVILYTLMMWMPYIMAQFYSNGTFSLAYLDGVWKKMSYDDPKLMRVPPPAWADRAARAHLNAVENLVIFAPLVLMAQAKGIDVDLMAQTYLIARILHYPAQCIGPHMPAVRTLAFATGWAACVMMGVMLIL